MMILLAWVHLVSAAIWVGGMLFLSIILVPVFRRGTFGADRRMLFQALARRFRIAVWIAVGALVLTGPLLASSRTGGAEGTEDWNHLLTVKLWVVAGLLVVTAIHDFWLGPLVGRLRQEGSDSSPADQFLIRLSVLVSRLGVLLALAILFLAVMLVRA